MVNYIKETINNVLRIERVYDLAGRVVVIGTVVSGKISQGMTSTARDKRFVVERIEVKGAPIDYLLQDETGDLIIYGRGLEKDDFRKGQIQYFE